MNPLPPVRKLSLVAIGCSAGGVEALSEILPGLGPESPPTVVAIHVLAGPRSFLSEVFGPRCRVPVKEAEDKEPIEPGRIYFAPAGYHLLVEKDRSFSLSVEDPVNFSRPSIDVLFDSASLANGPETLGILLTGANHDGADGMAGIVRRGGYAIVQDPAGAEHSTMPQSALDRIRPHAVWSLAEIRAYLAGGRNG